MNRAHIAFINYPNHPQVGPTLPMISVLARRGHRVTYATSARFSSRVKSAGGEVVLTSPIPTPDDKMGDYSAVIARFAVKMLEEITGFYEKNKPTLIVYDCCTCAGRILASRWKIPTIQSSAMFWLDSRLLEEQIKDAAHRETSLKFGRGVENFLADYGFTSGDPLFHRENLNIYLFPKLLQLARGQVNDDRCFFAGRCAGEQPYYGEWQAQNVGSRPIVLVSTSTYYTEGPDYFRMCIEALTGLDFHVILSIGDLDRTALGPLPANFEIVQNVSHVKILPYVQTFICAGSVVTASEAAYHGVPLVIASHGFPELELQAENLVEVGLGTHVSKAEMSADTLRNATLHMANDTGVRSRVIQIQKAVREEPGAEETANRIEQFL